MTTGATGEGTASTGRHVADRHVTGPFGPLTARIGRIPRGVRSGRVAAMRRGGLLVSGLGPDSGLGDRVLIHSRSGAPVPAEVIRLEPDGAVVLPGTAPQGIAVGDRVEVLPPLVLAPDEGWIGRIVSPDGTPLDGAGPLLPGTGERPLIAPPPPAARRRGLGERLATGFDLFNTVLPLARGQRIGLFAGAGVGKSTLIGQLARQVAADVVVIALVGERGRELHEFTRNVLGPAGMARAVVVAATSDQPPPEKRRAAWTATAIAEHFRDQGRHVLLIVDSVTRFAEAHREVALAAGEPPAMRGFPPSLSQAIAQLCERAGPGAEAQGDITAIYSVLVAGSDMDEPVADIIRGVLDGHVVLDRAIAERGRFPAVDVLRSVSRCLPGDASPAELELIAQTRRLLGLYDSAELLIRAGLHNKGADPALDRAVALWPALDGFFASRQQGTIADSFARLERLLQGGAESGSDAGSDTGTTGPGGRTASAAAGPQDAASGAGAARMADGEWTQAQPAGPPS